MDKINLFTKLIHKRRKVRIYVFRCILLFFVLFIFTQLIQEFSICREKTEGDTLNIVWSLTPEEINQFKINKGLYSLEIQPNLKKKLLLEGEQKTITEYFIQAKIVEKHSIFAPITSGENSLKYEKVKGLETHDNNSIRNIKSGSNRFDSVMQNNACKIGLIAQSINVHQSDSISGFSPQKTIFLWRDFQSDVLTTPLRETLLPTHAMFLNGVLFGGQDELPTEIKDNFKTIGLTHIVVASGYNVMLVTVAILWIGNFFFNFQHRRIFALMGIWMYVVLVGMTAPIIRAGIMMTVLLLSKMKGRPTQTGWVLIFSGILILILSPRWLFNLSFELSFLSTAGLVLLANILNSKLPAVSEKVGTPTMRAIFDSMRENFLTTISAMLFTAPLIAYHFQQLSLISLVANTFLLLFVPILMLLGALLILAWMINPFLGHMVGYLINSLLWLFFELVKVFSSPSWATVSIVPNGWVVLIYYVGLLISVFWLSRQKPKTTEKLNFLNDL